MFVNSAFSFDWNQLLEFGKTVKDNFAELEQLLFASTTWLMPAVSVSLATFIGVAIAGAFIKWAT